MNEYRLLISTTGTAHVWLSANSAAEAREMYEDRNYDEWVDKGYDTCELEWVELVEGTEPEEDEDATV